MNPPTALRVFIVEDSSVLREYLAEMMAHIDSVEVVGQADTEVSATSALNRIEWDVMLLDLQLRQGSGLGVLRDLHRARRPDTTVIVFTNYAYPQYRVRSLLQGADYFFDKQQHMTLLQSLVRQLAVDRKRGLGLMH